MDPDPPAPRYWGVLNVVGPTGRFVDLEACDAEGRNVEMTTDVVLEQDGWRVFWSRAIESGLEIDNDVRRRAARELSRAREDFDHLEAFGPRVVESETDGDSVADWPDSPVKSFLEDRLRGGGRAQPPWLRLLGRDGAQVAIVASGSGNRERLRAIPVAAPGAPPGTKSGIPGKA